MATIDEIDATMSMLEQARNLMQGREPLSFMTAKRKLVLEKATPKICANIPIICKALGHDVEEYKFISPSLREHPEIIEAVINKDPLYLQFMSEMVRDNEVAVGGFIEANPMTFKFASERLRSNEELVLSFLEKLPKHALNYISVFGVSVSCKFVDIPKKTLEIPKVKAFILEKFGAHGFFLLVDQDAKLLDNEEFVAMLVEEKRISLGTIKNKPFAGKFLRKLIENNAKNYEFAPDEVKNDLEVARGVVEKLPCTIHILPENLKNDREIAISALCGGVSIQPSNTWYNDKELLELLLSFQGLGYAHKPIGPNIKDDRDFVIYILTHFPWYFHSLSAEMKDDDEFAMVAIMKNKEMSQYTSGRLMRCEAFKKKMASADPTNLKYAPPIVQNDETAVFATVSKDLGQFKYASQSLRDNFDFVMKIFKSMNPVTNHYGCYIYNYLSDRLKINHEIIFAAAEKEAFFSWPNIPDEVFNDRDFMMKFIEESKTVNDLPQNFSEDKEMILLMHKVAKENGKYVFGSADFFDVIDFSKDPNFTLDLLKEGMSSFRVPDCLFQNRNFVLECVKFYDLNHVISANTQTTVKSFRQQWTRRTNTRKKKHHTLHPRQSKPKLLLMESYLTIMKSNSVAMQKVV